MAFDPFRFLADRKAGRPVDDVDRAEFQMYNVVQAISMDPRYRRVARELNRISFSHLPRDMQATALNGLCGVRDIDTTWSRAKTATLQASAEKVEHAMKVFGMSHNSVTEALRYGLINTDAVEERYTRLYEPEKLLDMYGGKPKRGKKK